jgi:thiamine biosynthesis lipoprotein
MGRDDTECGRLLYHTYMKLVFVMICLLAPGLAAAEWLDRVEDGIMGTRIHVELWADDPAKGQAAIEAVLDEMRRVDESMSTYKSTSEVSMVNARAAQGP